MKPSQTAFVVLMLGLTSAPAGVSRLEAISLIESGNDDRAIGRAGEVSRYQIRPRVWRCYSMSKAYTNPRVATRVAQQHLTLLETKFRQHAGREPTDFDCYVMWNGGFAYYARAGFRSDRVVSVIRERACRFVNLCVMETELQGTVPILAIGGVSPDPTGEASNRLAFSLAAPARLRWAASSGRSCSNAS